MLYEQLGKVNLNGSSDFNAEAYQNKIVQICLFSAFLDAFSLYVLYIKSITNFFYFSQCFSSK